MPATATNRKTRICGWYGKTNHALSEGYEFSMFYKNHPHHYQPVAHTNPTNPESGLAQLEKPVQSSLM